MKEPHVQVELAVLWADHTWSDGHFEYVPRKTHVSLRSAAAIQSLEKKLRGNFNVVMVVVYAVDGIGQDCDSEGNLLETE